MTGECADMTEAVEDELANYLGSTRVTWYGPFVVEWATCRIKPYDKLGLVLFEPGQQCALQDFWLRGLQPGVVLRDIPDAASHEIGWTGTHQRPLDQKAPSA